MKTLTKSLGLNPEPPQVMHIDLNSAFATTEQQAHKSLRGRPMGVTNRISKHCCVIAASYEAKALGVKVGMRLDEVRTMIPDFAILETDPPKYHYMYQKLAGIMNTYSSDTIMKSIDEGIIDFHGTTSTVNRRPLADIGLEIKQRLKDEVGSWMKANIGIGPNRFLAKTAAGLHKPDGLDVISYSNLRQVYANLQLTDLTGIASHFEARLKAAGIFTPLDFLEASEDTLRRLVFHSVVGNDWYRRLRGWEVDGNPTNLGSIGRQMVLPKASTDDNELLPILHMLAETTGIKLRYRQVEARGLIVWANLQTGDFWRERKMFKSSFYTNQDLWQRTLYLFSKRPSGMLINMVGLTCYQLTPSTRNQASLLEEVNRAEWLTAAVDEINDRYGMFTVFPADALPGKPKVKQKIPFGGTQYFELLLKRQ